MKKFRYNNPIFIISAILFGIYIPTHIIILYTGAYTCDEGNYLYSSTLAIKGQIPYKDFAFWQPPAMLYVYGIISAVFGHSLTVARWFSFLFGFAALILMSLIVLKKGNKHSLILLLILMSLNLSYSFDTTNVKTQSLSIFIYTLALYCAVCGKSWKVKYILSSLIMALSVGVRAAMLPAVVLFPFYLYFESGRNKKYLKLSLAFVFGTMLTGFALFYIMSDTKLMFGLWGFFKLTTTHVSVFEAWYLKELIGNQLVCYSLFLGILTFLVYTVIADKAGKKSEILNSKSETNANAQNQKFQTDSTRHSPLDPLKWISENPFESYCLLAYLGITLIHFTAPVKYPTHQTTNMPLMAMFIALTAGRFLEKTEIRKAAAGLIILVMFSLGSLVFQVYPVDRSGGKFPLAEIKQIAESIKPYMGKNGKIFTFETIIAYEGGYELLSGLTIGVENHFGGFGMSTEDCKKYKGVDNSIIKSYFENKEADVLIMQQREIHFIKRDKSGVSMDELMQTLHANYEKIVEFDKFGQFKQKTFCFAKKNR